MPSLSVDSERTVVTDQDGEVLSDRTRTVMRETKFEQEPDYVKLYIKTISVFKDVREIAGKVFYELVKLMSYAEYEQLVYLNPALRKHIWQNLGISQSSFDKAMRQLRDVGLISRISSNTYAVNPNFVGRGKWKDIRRLQANFDFITGDAYVDFKYDDEC